MQNLGRAVGRIDIIRMRRPEIAGELVQCLVTDKRAGRRVQHTVFGVKVADCGPPASGITFAENFRKIAVEQRLDTPHIRAHRGRDAPLLACWFIGRLLVDVTNMRSMDRSRNSKN